MQPDAPFPVIGLVAVEGRLRAEIRAEQRGAPGQPGIGVAAGGAEDHRRGHQGRLGRSCPDLAVQAKTRPQGQRLHEAGAGQRLPGGFRAGEHRHRPPFPDELVAAERCPERGEAHQDRHAASAFQPHAAPGRHQGDGAIAVEPIEDELRSGCGKRGCAGIHAAEQDRPKGRIVSAGRVTGEGDERGEDSECETACAPPGRSRLAQAITGGCAFRHWRSRSRRRNDQWLSQQPAIVKRNLQLKISYRFGFT